MLNNGKAVTWPDSIGKVIYAIDPGRLGPLTSSRAAALIRRSFDAWKPNSNSPYLQSWLKFVENSDPLPFDVNADNYQMLLNQLPSDINPIIFDDNGMIVDDLLGSGAKENILGFASVFSSNGQIVAARAIFNGYFMKRYNQTEEEIYSTVLHEIGHMCGLDHTQHSRHLAFDGIAGDDKPVSIMFPTATDSDNLRDQPTFDDQISISNLYPTVTHRNNTGSLAGLVSRSNQGLAGVNVIARDSTDPVNKVATTVTGTYELNRGTYVLNGLPPGLYSIMVEAIDKQFTGTSSVGPYSQTSNNASFRSPVKAEFYNSNDQATEGRSALTLVKVDRLKTSANINLNVDNALQPSDETQIELLGIGTLSAGGARRSSYSIEYLLNPNGDEGNLEIKVRFPTVISYGFRIRRETSAGQFDTQTFNRRGQEGTLIIGQNGELPLLHARYFLSVGNLGAADTTFTISAALVTVLPTPTPLPEPTATPTRTPTRTVTPTRTPTRTPTSRATNTPGPAFTPTPMATPTPPLAGGDVNNDGIVNAMDVFSFAQDWQKGSGWIFQSDLSPDAAPLIDHTDLLRLIQQIHAAQQANTAKAHP